MSTGEAKSQIDLSYSARTITVNDGTKIDIEADGVLVFVGPNNAGKSVALRNIVNLFSEEQRIPDVRVVDTISWRSEGDRAALQKWLESNATFNAVNNQWHRLGAAINGSWLDHAYGGPPLGSLASFFMYYTDAGNRSSSVGPAENINFLTEPLNHPLHFVYMDPELEDRLSSLCRRAFGFGLTLNRNAGRQTLFHVGDGPQTGPTYDATFREYLRAFSELPTLDRQGDGVRSFMGIALYVLTSSYFMVVIDEPETCLHPPQAQLLGRILAEEKGETTQLLIATHSSDILRGLLDSSRAPVTVVRLTREGDINRAAVISSQRVTKLWEDPILRYSNILDGLFNDGVVVCEGDSDCRFYSTILNQLVSDKHAPQILFTHSATKSRMAVVVDALAAVAVPTRVIADFDIIRDETEFRRLLVSLGGNWEDFKDAYKVVRAAVEQRAPRLATSFVKQELLEILNNVQSANLTENDIVKLRDKLKAPSPWEQAKKLGKAALPSGEATSALDQLVRRAEGCGLYIVPVGEVEQFVRDVGGHGPSWLASVFEKNLHTDHEATSGVREFMQRVVDSFR